MDYKKLHKRIDDMLKYDDDHFLANISLKQEVSDKLLLYQFLHVYNIMTALRANGVALDGSDTGTGKTFTTVGVCKQSDYKPGIICPATMISSWRRVCQLFDVIPLFISSYELIKLGKHYDENMKKVECPYLKIIEIDEEITARSEKYRWRLPWNSIIIFDEVHKCRNVKSENSQLLLSTKNLHRVLMLSATLSDNPKSFHVFGYMLGLYKSLRQGNNWINGQILEDKNYIGSNKKASAVNRTIYPQRGSRMQITELGDQFPKNQVSADCYDLEPKDLEEVNKHFDKLALLEKEIAKKENDDVYILAEIQKARLKIELLKLQIFKEEAEAYLENGYSVVIFLNYIQSIKELAKKLKTDSVITGDVDLEKRRKIVERFQENRSNIIIMTIGIAEGISLHDEHGVPRVSLISPTFSSIQLKQALGRICRAGQKTPALQRIIYSSNTCEEAICNTAKEKFKFTSKLNDDPLMVLE
jgi:hypothetical protein